MIVKKNCAPAGEIPKSNRKFVESLAGGTVFRVKPNNPHSAEAYIKVRDKKGSLRLRDGLYFESSAFSDVDGSNDYEVLPNATLLEEGC